MGSGILTADGLIEAYLFERHIDDAGINAVKVALGGADGVRFVAQFVGGFNLFARVVATDLSQLQKRIADDYFNLGVRSDWSVNLTGMRPNAPKRGSPDICALVRVRATIDPFELLVKLDKVFMGIEAYGAAVVTGSDFDVLVDLGGSTLDEVIALVLKLREVPGVGRTSTALADLADNAIRR
jgi:hypothetical protein